MEHKGHEEKWKTLKRSKDSVIADFRSTFAVQTVFGIFAS